jgi:hypothetical protein
MNMSGKAMVQYSVWQFVLSLDFYSIKLQQCYFLYFSTDIIEDLYSPRTAAMDFVNELIRKRGKGNLQKFIHFVVGIFMRYMT